MRFKTTTGSEYEIKADRIRRLNPSAEKRGDGEWLSLIRNPYVAVGEKVVIALKSLAKYGADDYGTPFPKAPPVTMRITSAVTEVINDEAE